MHVIAFTKVRLPFGWMSNMSPHPISYMNNVWRTSEALFQALRFDDYGIREIIRNEKSPMSAKMRAKSFKEQMTVEPQSAQDLANMMKVLELKLDTYLVLQVELIHTGDSMIIEDCTKRQRGSGLFWGAGLQADGTWLGDNHLGKMWMELRDHG